MLHCENSLQKKNQVLKGPLFLKNKEYSQDSLKRKKVGIYLGANNADEILPSRILYAFLLNCDISVFSVSNHISPVSSTVVRIETVLSMTKTIANGPQLFGGELVCCQSVLSLLI